MNVWHRPEVPLASRTDLWTGNFLLLGQEGGPGSLTKRKPLCHHRGRGIVGLRLEVSVTLQGLQEAVYHTPLKMESRALQGVELRSYLVLGNGVPGKAYEKVVV